MLTPPYCPTNTHSFPRRNDQCIAELQKLSENFKYVVTTTIGEDNGAGMDVSSCGYWDTGTDGSITVKWKNSSICCVVIVCGLAL